MLLTRSSPIVELVCLTGTRPPSGRRCGDVPGWQSMKYSPMNDCGRTSQRRVRAQVGQARLGDLGLHDGQRVRLALQVHVPGLADACTPAILKSPPLARPKALSSTIL